jgi:bacillithiol biosynthesis deacetylase BshB1
MTLDALVIAAHPDDAEISLGGTILRMVRAGAKVGVCDLTRGEMGTRGTEADRTAETRAATAALGLAVRCNLELPDGRVRATVESRQALAAVFREHAPSLVLAHHTQDLHPDHAACGQLAREAWYLSGLKRLAESSGGAPAHRPKLLMHFQGHVAFEPTLVVDISSVWEQKCGVIRCYASQLEPAGENDRGEHFLFGADILARAETKARYWGEKIGRSHGEPLLLQGPLAIGNPLDIVGFA